MHGNIDVQNYFNKSKLMLQQFTSTIFNLVDTIITFSVSVTLTIVTVE